MRSSSNVMVVDLRAPLLAAKARHPVYFRSDTHWNRTGALAGYQGLVAEARRVLPAVPADPLCTEAVEHPRKGGDLAEMLNMVDVWDDGAPEFTCARSPGAEAPALRLVIIGDSYMAELKPFFEQTFGAVTALHVTQDAITMERILASKPDLVIDERAERYLMEW